MCLPISKWIQDNLKITLPQLRSTCTPGNGSYRQLKSYCHFPKDSQIGRVPGSYPQNIRCRSHRIHLQMHIYN